MRQLIISAIVILSTFTALGVVCAAWFVRPRRRQHDPFFHPFGDVPGFSDQQLREIARRSAHRIARDPQRRSFVTRDLNSGQRRPPRVGPDAGGVGVLDPHSPRLHAVRSFIQGLAR